MTIATVTTIEPQPDTPATGRPVAAGPFRF
jgi:hypothetical protein